MPTSLPAAGAISLRYSWFENGLRSKQTYILKIEHLTMAELAMAKFCIFCCNQGTSEEHLWSKALGPEIAKWIPKTTVKSYKALQRHDGTEHSHLAGMYLHSTTVPCVCEPCNNGWMNRLDERTREKTIRLIRGQVASFSKENAQQLASWLAMKMMVRDEHKFTNSIFSPEDKSNYYLTGLPPQQMWIALGFVNQPIWASAFHRQSRKFFDQDRQMVHQAIWTMGLGATVAFVEYATVNQQPTAIPPNQLMRLWPSPETFEWPVHPTLTPAQARYLSVRYNPVRESAGDVSGQLRFVRRTTPPIR